MQRQARQVFGIALLITIALLSTSVEFSHLSSAAPSLYSQDRISPVISSSECATELTITPFSDAGYCFIQSLVHSSTGLVASRENECFTTVYKNSLGAMVFIHQGNIDAANKIFNFFQSRITNPFPGFRQAWDPCNGNPISDSNPYWEGDNAFLLLALNYYAQVTGSYGNYSDLAYTLKDWLTERANSCNDIVAEGAANMYAALAPFNSEQSNWKTLSKLYQCFFSKMEYTFVLDHSVRAALVFGDTTGFGSVDNFKRNEIWQYDERTETNAYAAFSSEHFINTEISAQLLLAWSIWQHELSLDLSPLRSELEGLRLPAQSNSLCSGLPYLIRHPTNGGFSGDYSLPIIDPTAYLLYNYWKFNPFAPGRMNAVCRYDRYIPLLTEGQEQGFPRLYRVGQDLFSQFPQEINSNDHKQIVVDFTTTEDLSQIPLTLTIDTIDRDPTFQISIKFDNSDHCLDICDREETYAYSGESGAITLEISCKKAFLPAVSKEATLGIVVPEPVPSADYNYHLVLEGDSGWGVFDWLQLSIPGKTLWTIGNKDNRCDELDNSGFIFTCN